MRRDLDNAVTKGKLLSEMLTNFSGARVQDDEVTRAPWRTCFLPSFPLGFMITSHTTDPCSPSAPAPGDPRAAERVPGDAHQAGQAGRRGGGGRQHSWCVFWCAAGLRTPPNKKSLTTPCPIFFLQATFSAQTTASRAPSTSTRPWSPLAAPARRPPATLPPRGRRFFWREPRVMRKHGADAWQATDRGTSNLTSPPFPPHPPHTAALAMSTSWTSTLARVPPSRPSRRRALTPLEVRPRKSVAQAVFSSSP